MPDMSSTKWVSFDCFGTLVDWCTGIRLSAELVSPGHGADLLAAYNRHEQLVQSERPGLRYRQVLAESLARAARELGIGLSDDNKEVLGATIPFWPVFPDVYPELSALRDAGWHLALLTNCDRDIIGQTQRRLRVPVDAVVTAEDAGAYKPAHNHFQRFMAGHDVQRSAWVHVAQSHVHDMVPASELGISRVWINRHGESLDPAMADAVLPDLRDLLATVEKVNAARA
jgi:2-haloacid dehalogenase